MIRAVALLVGVVLLAAAALRRWQLLRRRRAEVDAGLRSDDPARRALARREVAAVGLRSYAPTLLALVAELTPEDPRFAEIVALVARCQWEPADEPGVVQLRLWAAAAAGGPGPIVTSAGTEAVAEPVAAPASLDLPARAAAALDVPVDRVRFRPFAATPAH